MKGRLAVILIDVKVLLINHHSAFLGQLERMLGKYDVEVMDWQEPNLKRATGADVIVLSGGHALSVARHPIQYAPEFELVRNSHQPIIGICLGCQIITAAYGGKIQRLERKVKGIRKIEVLKDGPLFKGQKSLEVYQSHRWGIKRLPPVMEGLARSSSGFEIIKHKNKPHYGLQFHPEVLRTYTTGHLVVERILQLL